MPRQRLAFWLFVQGRTVASPVAVGLFVAGWICAGGLSAGGTSKAEAGDWPQILGPARNGQAKGERLLASWPAQGPEPLWKYPLGAGFAGPAAVGARVVVFHRLGDTEVLEALDRGTGKRIWRTEFPASYVGSVNPDSGPRCVPLVHEDGVYVFGAAGHLHAVRLDDGAKRWSRDTYADFRGDEGYFGAGSSPVVAGNRLVVNVGGKNAGVVAFDLKSGQTVWKATDERASYSSPALATIEDREHVLFVTRLQALALDPNDGSVRYQFPFGQRGPTVNAATPLVFGEHFFVTASYGIGGRLGRLADGSSVWENDESMSSQYSTCVYHDGHLYGTHGREDFRNGELRCVDASTGKVQWAVPGFGIASIVLVGERMLILGTEGKLTLAQASPQKFVKLAEATVASGITRALPALSEGHFVFRTNEDRGDQGSLVCLVVGER